MKNAHAAGIANVDVYIFPNTKEDAASSMKSIVQQMQSQGVLSKNMIWMDIEGSQYWSSSCTTNQVSLAHALTRSLALSCELELIPERAVECRVELALDCRLHHRLYVQGMRPLDLRRNLHEQQPVVAHHVVWSYRELC